MPRPVAGNKHVPVTFRCNTALTCCRIVTCGSKRGRKKPRMSGIVIKASGVEPVLLGNRPAWWRVATPLAVIAILALLPPPSGLAQHAWYFFAIFSGVVAALVLEP